MNDYNSMIKNFASELEENEKSRATVEKYVRDAKAFVAYLGEREITKHEVLGYKRQLTEGYAPTSINSMLVSVNSFLHFIGKHECRVRLLKLQRQIFANENRELTKEEYRRLVSAAGSTRLSYILQTICETGIRISELKYITVEAVERSRASVDCKGKNRIIFIPPYLRKLLLRYIKKTGIKTGSIFVSESGRPLCRSNIWRSMKSLCEKAGVESSKVFPHNLRHLFAKTFYAAERDIVKLADILGHSSINTTRIYTMESGQSHIDCLKRMHSRLIS